MDKHSPTDRLHAIQLAAELPAEVNAGQHAGARRRLAAGKATLPSPSA